MDELKALQKENTELKQLAEAYESIFYFSTEELKIALDTIKAYEANAHFVNLEMVQRDKTIEALDNLFNSFSQEIKEKFEIIKAFENASELSNKEKKALYTFIASSMKTIHSSQFKKEVINKIMGEFKHQVKLSPEAQKKLGWKQFPKTVLKQMS